jgi:hypothetical protein
MNTYRVLVLNYQLKAEKSLARVHASCRHISRDEAHGAAFDKHQNNFYKERNFLATHSV